MERLEWKIDYNYEDIKEKILGLEQKANECMMQIIIMHLQIFLFLIFLMNWLSNALMNTANHESILRDSNIYILKL